MNFSKYSALAIELRLQIDIIDAFKASLKNLKWMDQESATAAAEKVITLSLFDCTSYIRTDT